MRVLFRRPPAERYVRLSAHIALQWLCRGLRGRPTGVDRFVAGTADDKRLAPPHRHEPSPRRFLASSWFVEVCEMTDVVDFHVVRCSACLAPTREEPMDQLVAARGAQGRRSVGEGCCGLSV